jgi:cytidylate kinase
MAISREILVKQNAETSNAIIDHWKDSEEFLALAKAEGDLTIQRDEEDAVNLQKGIDFAKSKGVIDPNFVSEPYVTLDVLGKTPAMVADEILGTIKSGSNSSSETNNAGSVIVLCGLSGTGKGTTVSNLCQKLEQDEGKKVVTWSNGNIFRSVTLLAVTWCEQQSDIDGFDKDKALTKENLQSFISMLSFGKFNGKYDTRINGLGLDMLVSEVQNTELKSPKVSKNISTVAEVTQGEVILFAADAVDTMGKDGVFVLLEGREQTVNYVRTPFRFTLVLSDESLIGKRRAAQRVMAAALSKLSETATEEQVGQALDQSLKELVSETGHGA